MCGPGRFGQFNKWIRLVFAAESSKNADAALSTHSLGSFVNPSIYYHIDPYAVNKCLFVFKLIRYTLVLRLLIKKCI